MQERNTTLSDDQIRALTWRKSTFSGGEGNSCVELAKLPDGRVGVRNSRSPEGPAIAYTRDEIVAFLAGVKHGEFDDLV